MSICTNSLHLQNNQNINSYGLLGIDDNKPITNLPWSRKFLLIFIDSDSEQLNKTELKRTQMRGPLVQSKSQGS